MTAPATAPPLSDREKLERRLWAAVNHDYERALALAVKFWPLQSNNPETVAGAAASLLNHFRELRRIATAPSRSGKAGGQPGAKAAAPAPPCPVCNSAVYDNRTSKTSAGAPDFRCKNKSCLDAGGKQYAGWVDPKAEGGVRWAKPAPPAGGGGGYDGGGYDDLDGEDDDLPF
jgi:hypothetical protein